MVRFPPICFLLLALAVWLGSVSAGDSPRMAVTGAPVLAPAEVEDPFPITRIRVTEDQLAEALKPFEASTMVRMPRAEFEARVRKAALIVAEGRNPPHLVEAKYTASLAGGSLTGDAHWIILNPQANPVFFPLDPLKIAVHSPTWADGNEAVLGMFGAGFPNAPGLWVPAGKQSLKMKWSAAGTGTAADRQFELRVPPCSAAMLDLELPVDRVPTSSSDVLLTGPFPHATDPKLKIWRFRFGDRTRLEFGVRGPGDGAGIGLAALSAKYELLPGRIAVAFEFDLRVSRGSVAEWLFALDPGLTILDAVANDRSGWRVDAATRELHVALRQPASAGKVVITATAPLPPRGQINSLPIARAINALTNDEHIELHVHPDLDLERLDAGDYRIAQTATTPDGTRHLSLTGALLPSGTVATRRSPMIRVAEAEAEFTSNEAVEWRIDAGRTHFAARVELRVRRGPLFRTTFRAPPGFTLERVTSVPEDVVSYSGTTPAGVVVEYAKPLTTGQRVELAFEFRGQSLASQNARLPFPHFAPLGANERDGWISFTPGAAWSLTPLPHPGAIAATDIDWPDRAPSDAAVAYLYRGNEPDGEMLLAPIRPAFSAAIDGSRIALKVTAGQLPGIVAFEPVSASKRTWKLLDSSNAIAAATPMNFGGFPPVNKLAPLFVGTQHGTYWFLRFARPATGDVILETTSSGPARLSILGAAEVQSVVDGGTVAPETKAPTSRAWSFEGLHLITLAAESHTLVVFGGAVTSRGGSVLPVAMPEGAEVRAACVGGYWLDPGRCELVQSELRLPIPAGNGSVRFEIRYRVPTSGSTLRSTRSPEPTLPGEGYAIARWWAFPHGIAAVWPFGVHHRLGAADLPMPLGEPLDRSAGELTVSQYPGDAVWTMPTRVLDAIGAGFAAMLAALAWFGARRANRSLGIAFFVVLIVVGIGYWLGPAAWERVAFPPLVAALVGASAIAVARGRQVIPQILHASNSSGSSSRINIRFAILVGLTSVVSVRAQPASPRDVAFILAGPTGETIIVSRTTLDRLDATHKKPEPTAVISSALYTGQVEDGFARFGARYVVHSFREGETAFELPLADARLERVTVDGKPALPIAVRPDLYTVTIADRGRHEIEVRFATTIATTGPEREVRFGVPEVPDSRVSFATPAAARQLQAVGRLGEQKTTPDKTVLRLEAGLGGIRNAQLRWREGAAGTAAISAREGCIWDVAENGHTLTACYQVRIDSGSTNALRFDLPTDLEPVRVAARSLDILLGQNLLRDWSIGKEAAGLRPLQIVLNGATDGRLLVTLECVPRGVPTRQPVLRFPRPVGMTRTDAIYGLRANGVAIESIGRLGVIDFAADALTRDFGAVTDLRLNPAVPIVAFSPRLNEAAELRPVLRSSHEAPAITQDLTWSVAPPRAKGNGSIKWSAKEPLAMLEFTLAATVNEVRGADVSGWAQSDGYIQVWFRKPLKEGSVEWIGSFAPSAIGKPVPVPLAFDPPVPNVLNARIGTQIVRVRPADGWAMRIERDKGWNSLPTSERGWAFQAEGVLPTPRLQFFPPVSGTARGFGMIEVTGTEVSYRTTMEIALGPNRPHHLVLHGSGLPVGAATSLDAPPGTIVHEDLNEDGSRDWHLDVPASTATNYRTTLTVRFAAKGTISLPAIDLHFGGSLSASTNVVRWLGLSGAKTGVKLEGATASDVAAIQAAWPGEVDRLRRAGGTVWNVTSTSAKLVFPQAAPPAPKTPATPPKPATYDTAPISPVADSHLPLATALAWCGGVLGVAVLFVRSPRLTWPEQVGLLGGLFGTAVAGGVAVGIVLYAIARIAWFVGWLTARR